MKNKLIKLSLLLLFIAASFVFVACNSDEGSKTESEIVEQSGEKQLWTCGMHPEVILEEPGQCPKCGMNLVPLKKPGGQAAEAEKPNSERKILYWQAPMNPTEIYDKPGKSKMGMDLVPVYNDQVSTASSIQIDPVTVQNMGVRIAPVERVNFSRSVRSVGKVDYNEQEMYVISSKINGWIEKLYVEYTGEEVRKHQTLLEIYSPELVTTQQEYLLAIKNRELMKDSKFAGIREGAESLLNASRQRLTYWDIPQSAIQNLEETGKVRKTLSLESPANGVVVHKNVEEGMHIKEGMSLYRVADLSTVWVHASIYDSEVPWVRVGQRAEMELSYAPGKILEGKVSYIYPYLDEKARDVKVRIEFPNPGLSLKPGMYANVRIQTPAIQNAIVVPSEAVIRSGRRNVVFLAGEEGRFEPREVTIGEESDDGRIRIVNGLIGNEKVVISAQFMLDSESRLQEAIQKMLQEKTGNSKTGQKSGNMESMDMPVKDDESSDMSGHDHSQMTQGEDQEMQDHDQNAIHMDQNIQEHDHSKMDHSGSGHEDHMQDEEHKEMQMDDDMQGHDHSKMDHSGSGHEEKMNDPEHKDVQMDQEMNGHDHSQMEHEDQKMNKSNEHEH